MRCSKIISLGTVGGPLPLIALECGKMAHYGPRAGKARINCGGTRAAVEVVR
jgi:hypothetical protein